MLGSIIGSNKWNWAAVGKHPSAKDYIRIGGTTPLMDAVAQWSAAGYRALNPDKTNQPIHHSWRFWLKGIKKGTLICGLGRDSSDSIGRPYPLIIMGEGRIRGWEKQWFHLPAMLEKTWNRMEFVASHRYDDARAMEDEVNRRMSTPRASSEDDAEAVQDTCAEGCSLNLSKCKDELARDGISMISLNQTNGVDPHILVLHCHRGLETFCGGIPRGVFIGGTPQQAYLAVIQHPLGAEDFVKLWTC